MRQLRKRERDCMNSAERVHVRKKWRAKDYARKRKHVQETEHEGIRMSDCEVSRN